MLRPIYFLTSLILVLAYSNVWAARPVANKPPTVNLTSPVSGTTYVAPASIIMSATASDTDGTISKVEFYRGATLVGTSAVAPYSVIASNVPAGTYTLTAKAFDNGGATTTSTGISVTVTAASNIIITTPLNGATVYDGSVTVSGSFVGDVSSTVLVDNGNSSRLATINGTTFTVSLPIFPGANTLTVQVARTDKTFDNTTLTVIGNERPYVAFKSPSVNIFNAPANILFEVDAVSPNGSINKVEFFRSETLLGALTSPPYRYNLTNANAGYFLLNAIATDNKGVTGSSSLVIVINGPNALPTIALTAPSNGALFTAPANINLSANASDSDGSIVQVDFLRNGEVFGASNVSPYNFTMANVPVGSYQLTARATDDRAGTTTSAPVSITVTPPNNPPTVTLTSPVNGASFYAPAVIGLGANAADSDGTISKVEFYQGAALVGTATSPPYSISLTNVSAGSYSLIAKATDNLGAVTASTPVAVIVNPNTPPTVTLTSPASAVSAFAPASFTLKADAADSDGIAKVEFYQDATLIGTATSAPYTVNWANIPAGIYSVTAKATDNLGGATVSTPVSVTVKAAQLAFTTPVDGATLTGDSVLVTGSFQGEINSGVTVNGVVAVLDANNNFYATVPLAAGANILTATLTSFEGNVTTKTLTVTGDGVAPAIQINADQIEGLAPLTVNFSVEGAGITGGNIVAGGGTVTSTFDNGKLIFTVIYPNPGTYPVTVTATNSQGNNVSKNFIIVVQDAARMDLMLKEVWDGMNNALIAGDKKTAMKYQ